MAVSTKAHCVTTPCTNMFLVLGHVLASSYLNVPPSPHALLFPPLRSMVLGSFVNGVYAAPSWGSSTLNEYKINFDGVGRVGITVEHAANTTVGILVDATTSLVKISGNYDVGATEGSRDTNVYYAIFNPDLSYCPLGYSSTPYVL